jgi:hypothetical protein
MITYHDAGGSQVERVYEKPYDSGAYETRFPSQWIITDVRFPNEAKAILDKGGILIRMLRSVDNPNSQHESEIALDNWENWSHVIDNRDMTLEQLEQTVNTILNAYEI